MAIMGVRAAPCKPTVPRQIRGVKPIRAASSTATAQYFVVANNFKVKAENQADFEEVWRTRESHLKEMPGFVRFALLKCTNVPGEYISQTFWESEEAFKNWTQSHQFQQSHNGVRKTENGEAPKRPAVSQMLSEPPMLKVFETITVSE